MRTRPLLLILLTLTTSLCLTFGPRAAAQAPAKAVEPFLTDQTLAVVRLDATRVDMKAVESWLAENLRAGMKDADKDSAERLDAAIADMSKGFRHAGQFLDAFRKAGGREMLVVLGMSDFGNEPPAVIVPLGDGADAEALTKLLGGQAEQVGNVLVAGVPGARQRLRATHDDAARAAPHKELLEALRAAGGKDAAIHAVLAASPDTRRALEELAPQLPPELGGGPTADLTGGLRYASVTAQAPPKPSINVVIQSSDAQSAEALKKAADDALAAARKELANEGAPQSASEMLEKLVPAQQGERVVLALDASALGEMARAAGPALIQARQQALRVQSASNIRQLLQASLIYANEHKGEWPATLEAAMKDLSLPAAVTTNPARPKSGYAYVKPPKNPKDAAARIVIYEAEAGEGGRNVGFADGHVEWMVDARFQEALKKQKEADEKQPPQEGGADPDGL